MKVIEDLFVILLNSIPAIGMIKGIINKLDFFRVVTYSRHNKKVL